MVLASALIFVITYIVSVASRKSILDRISNNKRNNRAFRLVALLIPTGFVLYYGISGMVIILDFFATMNPIKLRSLRSFMILTTLINLGILIAYFVARQSNTGYKVSAFDSLVIASNVALLLTYILCKCRINIFNKITTVDHQNKIKVLRFLAMAVPTGFVLIYGIIGLARYFSTSIETCALENASCNMADSICFVVTFTGLLTLGEMVLTVFTSDKPSRLDPHPTLL
ncbi:hypothetical protein BGX24_000318 [Mortierella sp. AD032]|nr:hypothetical protein BGX24_000318 [Mortierella sp. AD032]